MVNRLLRRLLRKELVAARAAGYAAAVQNFDSVAGTARFQAVPADGWAKFAVKTGSIILEGDSAFYVILHAIHKNRGRRW